MDLTPDPKLYMIIARQQAELDFDGQKVSSSLVASYACNPGFRLAVEAAYRAGREDAARDIARVADSTRQSLVSTPPEYGREQYYHRTRAEAFERAVIIARGVDQPRTPSGCDGEDSPEERR